MDSTTQSSPVNPSPAPLGAGATPAPRATSDTRLSGRWLVIARRAFGAVVLLCLVLLVVGLRAAYAQFRDQSVTPSCFYCADWLPSWVDARALQSLGFSPRGFALYAVLLIAGQAVVWCLVGGAIAWRKSDDWLALLVAGMLITYGVVVISGLVGPLEQGPLVWRLPTQLVEFLSIAAFCLIFALFPNGRFVPRWTRWLVLISLPVEGSFAFFPPRQDTPYAAVLSSLLMVGAACLVVAQLYRYWRVSDAGQRQQTKWVVVGVTGQVIGLLCLELPLLLDPLVIQHSALYELVGALSWTLGLLALPISIGVAILRSHLWDIDRLINRALVYGTLTALLAALYVGVVIGLQAGVGLLNGQASRSPVIIVATTLLIAALFNRLRRALQATIDRRFYRRKYDAARTLQAFGQTLRSEVDLEQLSAQLMSVVEETMQPVHASLWLRPTDRRADYFDQSSRWSAPPRTTRRMSADPTGVVADVSGAVARSEGEWSDLEEGTVHDREPSSETRATPEG